MASKTKFDDVRLSDRKTWTVKEIMMENERIRQTVNTAADKMSRQVSKSVGKK